MARRKKILLPGNIVALAVITLSLVAGVAFFISNQSTEDRGNAYIAPYPHIEIAPGPTDGSRQTFDAYIDGSGMRNGTVIITQLAFTLAVNAPRVLAETDQKVNSNAIRLPRICDPNDPNACPEGFECYQPSTPDCPPNALCPQFMPAPYCKITNNSQVCWNKVTTQSDRYFWPDGCRGRITDQACIQVLTALTDAETNLYKAWQESPYPLPSACGTPPTARPSARPSTRPTPTPKPFKTLYENTVLRIISDNYDVFDFATPVTVTQTDAGYLVELETKVTDPRNEEVIKKLARLRIISLVYQSGVASSPQTVSITKQSIRGFLPGSTSEVELYTPNFAPSPQPSQPTASCQPRPACLDATPRCLLPEPENGWCPSTSPRPSCRPKPVCITAPCEFPEPPEGWCEILTPSPYPSCQPIDCAAPPSGCRYIDADPCRTCGRLVCTTPTPFPSTRPSITPSCQPRPNCLDNPPFCLLAEPPQGWCPASSVQPFPTPTPTPQPVPFWRGWLRRLFPRFFN